MAFLVTENLVGALNVRNLDDDLIRRLKQRAARHGRTAEAEHREILKQALAGETGADWESMRAELHRLLSGRKHTPSEVLQREGRDER